MAKGKQVRRDEHGRAIGPGKGRGKADKNALTPLGIYLRELRKRRGIAQKDMAAAIDVTPAYLSALEHGKRGRPSFALVQRIIHYIGAIWDEAERIERLVDLSDPRVTVDTSGLPAVHTELACRIAQGIANWDEATVKAMLKSLPKSET